jgi:hypothetical protein
MVRDPTPNVNPCRFRMAPPAGETWQEEQRAPAVRAKRGSAREADGMQVRRTDRTAMVFMDGLYVR